MTNEEKTCIRAVIQALSVPRNKFGKLEGDMMSGAELHKWGQQLKIPHGGYDRVDQVSMVLARLIGDKPVSIIDGGKR